MRNLPVPLHDRAAGRRLADPTAVVDLLTHPAATAVAAVAVACVVGLVALMATGVPARHLGTATAAFVTATALCLLLFGFVLPWL
ncbi:hypothetical protein GCM10022243_14050 [Saccharothrix violaceirubra]|uniref:Uncharacterized protein n=1 Tax=Saccharothrix violaceirubra TaxID=413306 RepID=A0A7W7WXB6_9PSEU|nr:hypothetical protein [Saccharothrix violaceirubra]MBB4967279.1 hypothetical protein [Saccharothrix violaceirubra]